MSSLHLPGFWSSPLEQPPPSKVGVPDATHFDTTAELIFGSLAAEGIPSDHLHTLALNELKK